MKCFGLTDKGKVRTDNQDSFIIEKCEAKDCLIVALCDGMGGAKAGGFASQLSNKEFVSYVYAKLTSRAKRVPNYKDILMRACADANGVSYEYSQFDEEYKGMGTTLVGGIVKSNGTGHIINVGDSRGYLISKHSMSITQITKDHSLVEELVDVGAITREQARTHPQRNIITRAIGSDAEVEADYFQFTLHKGDILLLCSDGLSTLLSDQELLDFAMEHTEPESLCHSLMDEALDRGARDNVTVVAVMK